MPDVLVTLREEHRYLNSLLDLLEEKADKVAAGRSVDFRILRDILHYLVHYPEEYHHPREEILFERLRRRDPGSEPLLGELHRGHERIHELANALFRRVDPATGSDEGDADLLAERLMLFITGYRHHMALEDRDLLPRAVTWLEPRDWIAIKTSGRYVDDPLFGPRVAREYRDLANYMLDRMEFVRRDFALAELFGVELAVEGLATLSNAGYQFGSAVTRALRASWDQNLAELKTRMRRPDPVATACLPFTLLRNHWRHVRAAGGEFAEILTRTGEDLKKPYQSRMDYLKNLLRHDWSAAEDPGSTSTGADHSS